MRVADIRIHVLASPLAEPFARMTTEQLLPRTGHWDIAEFLIHGNE